MKTSLAVLLLAICAWSFPGIARGQAGNSVSARDLPAEAQQVLLQMRSGGPFLYSRDGITFGNFEKRLPIRPRGYYKEYTVPTPGVKGRGARRIIAGQSGELYYTDDHYGTFRRIRE